ncbi:hypothetical protein [Marinitoga sp. 1155]|uniref:hypothetical protein n=1 Tax=Marinitoga sp. 1155 TaxID=1428448 RepID=UPI000640E607|nr:hypothetical protein [Marinitoga sp. 1155]KLO21885.1 hypothetical protein X274_09430 [Marinitoga sp. 1155]
MKLYYIIFIIIIILFISCERINYMPTIPENIYPPDKSENIEINPILKWNSYDQNGDILYYTLYFGEDDSKLEKLTTNSTSTQYILQNLKFNTRYYWKVEVTDNKNTGSVISPVWSFITKKNTPPVWQPIETQTATVNHLFEINLNNYVSDPDNNNITISKLSNFGKVENGIFSWLPDSEGTFSAKFIAYDSFGATSSISFDIIVNAKPNNPPLIKINGVQDNAIMPFNFEISWEISDPDNDNIISTKIFLNEELIMDSITDTNTNLKNLERNKDYTLKIIAKDEKNNEAQKIINFKTVDKAMVGMRVENNKLILYSRDTENIVGMTIEIKYDYYIEIGNISFINDAKNPDLIYGPEENSKIITIDFGFLETRSIKGDFLEIKLNNYQSNTKITFKDITVLLSPSEELTTDFSSWIILK